MNIRLRRSAATPRHDTRYMILRYADVTLLLITFRHAAADIR